MKTVYLINSRRKKDCSPVYNNNRSGLSGIYLCLILISSWSLGAQESQNGIERHWNLGAGIFGSRASVIDRSFSSVPYSGNGPGVLISAGYQKKRSLHELTGYFTKATLKTGSPSNSKSDQTYVGADYCWLYEIAPRDQSLFIWRAGAGINAMYARREYGDFINNNESFEFATSLSGVIEGRYFFNTRRSGFSIANRLYLPFVSYLVQPVFGQEGEAGSAGNDSRVAGFSSFFRICNFLSLEKELSHHQKISLFYGWEYYQIRDERAVKQGLHKLGATYNFAL